MKKNIYLVLLVLGIVLLVVSLFIPNSEFKAIQGICLGIGAGLFAMSIANLIMQYYQYNHPDIMKANEIEFSDERNTLIRYRSKATAGDITQWLIILIAFIMIFIDAPLWATLVTIGVYLMYNILGIYFISKYSKKM